MFLRILEGILWFAMHLWSFWWMQIYDCNDCWRHYCWLGDAKANIYCCFGYWWLHRHIGISCQQTFDCTSISQQHYHQMICCTFVCLSLMCISLYCKIMLFCRIQILSRKTLNLQWILSNMSKNSFFSLRYILILWFRHKHSTTRGILICTAICRYFLIDYMLRWISTLNRTNILWRWWFMM